MIDGMRCFLLSGSITLFANVPQMFEWPIEKIGFGALLFLIVWTYLNRILPKTHDEIDRKNKRIEELIVEIGKLNDLLEKERAIIAEYIVTNKRHGRHDTNIEPDSRRQ